MPDTFGQIIHNSMKVAINMMFSVRIYFPMVYMIKNHNLSISRCLIQAYVMPDRLGQIINNSMKVALSMIFSARIYFPMVSMIKHHNLSISRYLLCGLQGTGDIQACNAQQIRLNRQ